MARLARRAPGPAPWLALAAVCAGAGCSGESAPPPPAPAPPPPAPAPAAPPDAALLLPAIDLPGMLSDEGGVTARVAPTRPKNRPARPIDVMLKSEPRGALAAVDGRVIGTTPTLWAGESDGLEHEFTFSLAGHAFARYRFVPITSGVLHVTLQPVATEPPDGGLGPLIAPTFAPDPEPEPAPAPAPVAPAAPSGVAPVPSGVAPVPSGVAPVPSGAAPAPSGVAPAPSGVAPAPSEAAPAPAGAAPAPSGAAPAPAPAGPPALAP